MAISNPLKTDRKRARSVMMLTPPHCSPLKTEVIRELPVGKGKRFVSCNNGFVDQFLGGWSKNGIYTYMEMRGRTSLFNFSYPETKK
jgi:hypothetical protein